MRVLKKSCSIYVWRNIQLNKSRIILFTSLFILALMLFTLNQYPYASVGLVMLPLAYMLGAYSYSKYSTWSSGLDGENQLLAELDGLGDEYYLISGVVIPPNRGDTDYIVLGPNGLFVIESKSISGEISCRRDDWSRRKIGRGGKPYELVIGSPSNQVKRNAKVLKDFILEHQDEIFLERNAPHIWIHSAVVFTRDDTKLYLEEPTVDVLRPNEMVDYIVNQESESTFTDKELENMGEYIVRHST